MPKRTASVPAGRRLKRTKHVYVKRRPKYRRNFNPYRAEIKSIATNRDEQAISTLSQFSANNYWPLNSVTQNASTNGRTGDVIVGKRLVIRGVLNNNGTNCNMVRMIVASPDDNDTLVQMQTASFMFYDNGALTVSGLNCMYYPIDKRLFKRVYKDKVYKLGSSTSLDGSQVRQFIMNINLKNLRLKYDGTSIVADTPIYMWFFAAEAADDSVGQNVEVSYISRFFFQDV